MRPWNTTTRGTLAENPVGQHITWTVRDRQYLCEVIGARRDEVRGCVLLQTRHLCGDSGPEVVWNITTVLEDR